MEQTGYENKTVQIVDTKIEIVTTTNSVLKRMIYCYNKLIFLHYNGSFLQ